MFDGQFSKPRLRPRLRVFSKVFLPAGGFNSSVTDMSDVREFENVSRLNRSSLDCLSTVSRIIPKLHYRDGDLFIPQASVLNIGTEPTFSITHLCPHSGRHILSSYSPWALFFLSSVVWAALLPVAVLWF